MTTIAPARPAAPAHAGMREWLALAVLMMAVLTVSMDNTALSFAVPQLSAALQPSSTQMLWIIDVYPLVLAGLLLTMGVLGDRLGRRLVLMVGTAGFGVLSVVAAFAPDAASLVVVRALLGFFGAMLAPSTLSLLRNLFVDPAQRRLAIAVWAAGFAGGGALGPIVGGWLLEHYWWGAIFLISVPPCLALLVTGPVLLPESRNPDAGRLDLVSVLLSIGALVPFLYAVKRAAADGFDATATVTGVVALLLGALFVVRQLRLPEPLLDLQLFRVPPFTAAIVANSMSVLAYAGLLYFASQHLQYVVGRSPIEAATALLPGAIATILSGFLAVRLTRFLGVPTLIVAGLLIGASGFALGVTLTVDSPPTVIVAMFIAVGAGVGIAETLTNDLIIGSVPADRAGAAAGISETAYELGTALGIALLGSLLNWRYTTSLELPHGLDASVADAASQTLGGAMAVAGDAPVELREPLREAARVAFENGVVATSLSGAIVMLIAAIVVGTTFAGVRRRAARAGAASAAR